MKVAHFCTFPHGGAAAAAIGQHLGLSQEGVDSRFYYHRVQQDDWFDAWEQLASHDNFHAVQFDPPKSASFPTSAVTRRLKKMRQRRIYAQFNRHLAQRPPLGETFAMAELPEPTWLDWTAIQADVAHLHWLSFFADYPSFFRSIPDEVPIVWSLHDTAAFTGGCHYTGGCGRFAHGCGSCPQVAAPGPNDVSRVSLAAKRKALKSKTVRVIAPCDWMLNLARRSPVWPDATEFHKIEYGLDLEQYFPVDRNEARQSLGIDSDATVIAFGAMDVDNPRKGFQHLTPALVGLQEAVAERRLGKGLKLECLVFGTGEVQRDGLNLRFHEQGFVNSNERKRQIYSAADLVVVPSIEDNQPQVGLEAMACGTPVVAFDGSGLPEYVQHGRTGLLAELANETDLARKLLQMITHQDGRNQMGVNAVQMVRERFQRKRQMDQTIELYRSVVSEGKSETEKALRRAA